VCMCVCVHYSQEKWLDKDTRSVKIRFIFYNGNIGSLA
jgi:hypothetical protein